jgi:hypothetical protein
MRRPPKFVHGFIDRHGKPRWYFRRAGFKQVRLPGLPWSPEFMSAYEAVLSETPQLEIGARRTKPGTVAAAVAGQGQHDEMEGAAKWRLPEAGCTHHPGTLRSEMPRFAEGFMKAARGGLREVGVGIERRATTGH